MASRTGGLRRPPPRAATLGPGVDAEVRAEERAAVDQGILHAELFDDVPTHFGGGRGGQAEHRHAAKHALEPGEVAVRGSEVVTPKADAVGLVHCDEPQVDPAKRLTHGSFESFGRRVDELERSRARAHDPLASLRDREARVQIAGPQAHLVERVHLVLHERDERTHYQGAASQEPGRNLIRERFTCPGRHDANCIAPRKHGVDELALTGAKRVVAEDGLEDRLGICGAAVHLGATGRRQRRGDSAEHCQGVWCEQPRAILPEAPKLTELRPALLSERVIARLGSSDELAQALCSTADAGF